MLRNLVGLAIVLGLATCVVMPILAQEEAGEAVPAPAEPAITA